MSLSHKTAYGWPQHALEERGPLQLPFADAARFLVPFVFCSTPEALDHFCNTPSKGAVSRKEGRGLPLLNDLHKTCQQALLLTICGKYPQPRAGNSYTGPRSPAKPSEVYPTAIVLKRWLTGVVLVIG